MKLAKFLALSLVSAAFSVGSSGFAQTATTDPVGFSTVSLPVGASVVVPTLLNAAQFTGNAVISATAVTPSTVPNWTANAYQPTQFIDGRPNYPTHYVEVVEGTYEGYSFDIMSNSATALTVAVGEIPPALVNQTVKVVLRKHITLDDVSNGSTGLTGYSDLINIYNSDGSTSTRYFDGASWVADDYSTPAGHTIIYPGTGGFLVTTGSAQVVLLGGVKTTKTAIPLYAGVVNVVGPMNPGAQSLLVSADLASALSPYSDVINNFSANGSLANTGTYYSDGASILDSGYNALPGNAPDAVLGNHGLTIAVSANTYWISKSPLAP